MANPQLLPNFKPRLRYAVGSEDDVTLCSIPLSSPPVHIERKDMYEALFYGLGADGTIAAVKNTVRIIGIHTDLFPQAQFVRDAKKSGGLTVSNHARFGTTFIKAQDDIQQADYLACHHPSYLK